MASFRTALRFTSSGILKTLYGPGRFKGEARPFLLVRCSPAFHRLLKEAYAVRTGFATSCKSFNNASTITSSNTVNDKNIPTPPVFETDVFDELISAENMVEQRMQKMFDFVGALKNKGKKFQMNKNMQKNVAEIVKFSLLPTSSPDLRYRCLIVLLTQDHDLEETEIVLKQTVSDVMSLPIKVVMDIIQILSESTKTTLRESVRKDLVLAAVNNRWYEIGAKNVVFLMYQLDDLFDMKKMSLENRKLQKNEANVKVTNKSKDSSSESTSVKPSSDNISEDSSVTNPSVRSMNLETRTIAVTDELKVKDLSRVLLLLGKWRSRNEPLLNALLHRLSQDDLSDFSYIQLHNVLFACSVLRLHNEEFFEKISSSLSVLQPPGTVAACSILSSMSHLRWRDQNLTLATLDYLADKVEVMTTREANNVIKSLSNLYPVPFEEKHANLVIELCNKVYGGYPKDPEHISAVYSLAVLLLLSGELADSVLNSEFLQKVKATGGHSQQSLLHCLAQVNMAARLEVTGYQGSLLTDEELTSGAHQNLTQEVSILTANLLKAVKRFADLTNYVRMTEVLPPGIHVAAVMCANPSGAVLPLSSLDKVDNKESVHKLALLVVPYAAVTSPDQVPVGSQQMNARLLKHLGYIPVFILYSDLRPSNSPAETVNIIKQKISEAVKKHKSAQEASFVPSGTKTDVK